jgi:hypothetical protein
VPLRRIQFVVSVMSSEDRLSHYVRFDIICNFVLRFRYYLTTLVFLFTFFRMCPVCCPLLFVCLFVCSVSLMGHFAVASSRQSTIIELLLLLLLLLFRILFHSSDNVLLSVYYRMLYATSPVMLTFSAPQSLQYIVMLQKLPD